MTAEVQSLYDLAPGNMIGGRYRVVRPCRQGGLSTAFEVVDEGSEDRFEIQIFPSALFADQGQALDFAAAWEPWKRVESSAVQRLHEIVQVGASTLVLVADLPFGGSLREFLKVSPRLDRDQVLAIGRQLLAGLSEIHGNGLVHGDIKPSTIHVADDEGGLRAMMVDGGVTPGLWSAKNLGEHTALIGTPYYAPVEQFGGDSPDVQSDVYNLATVLFELLTGVLPWPGTNFLEVFQAKLDRAAPSMRARAPEIEVDPALERAIVGGLLADRAQRHSSAQHFLEVLEEVG